LPARSSTEISVVCLASDGGPGGAPAPVAGATGRCWSDVEGVGRVDARRELGDVLGGEEAGDRDVDLVRVGDELAAVEVRPPKRLDVEVEVCRRAPVEMLRAKPLQHPERLEDDDPSAPGRRERSDAVPSIAAPDRSPPAGLDPGEILGDEDAAPAADGLDDGPRHRTRAHGGGA